MNLLALETSTEGCSVALLADGAVHSRSEVAPRRHAELLLPMCEGVLADAGLRRSQLDAIAVGRGPGAFTGVRLAISAAQGIALALDIPVVPVSSLAALALEAPADAGSILAVIDARMGEIYAGVFRRGDDDLVHELAAETVGPADALQVPPGRRWDIVGTGWDTHADAIRSRLDAPPRSARGLCYPQATSIARLAAPRFASGHGLAPEQALPVYLRDKVALTTGEREAAARG